MDSESGIKVTSYWDEKRIKAEFRKICVRYIPSKEDYSSIDCTKAYGLMFQAVAFFHVSPLWYEDEQIWYSDCADVCNINHRGRHKKLAMSIAIAVVEARYEEEEVIPGQRKRVSASTEPRRRRRRTA